MRGFLTGVAVRGSPPASGAGVYNVYGSPTVGLDEAVLNGQD